MKKFMFLLTFQILYRYFKVISSQRKNLDIPQINHHNSSLYIYVPTSPFEVYENSIDICNESADLLDCVYLKDIKKEIGMSWDTAFIVLIKHVKDNLFIVPIMRNQEDLQDDMVSSHIIFTGEYFNIR